MAGNGSASSPDSGDRSGLSPNPGGTPLLPNYIAWPGGWEVTRSGPYYYLRDRSYRDGRRLNRILERYGRTRPALYPPTPRFGDALEELQKEPPASFDAIITDPPYACLNERFDKPVDWRQYVGELARVLKPAGQLVLHGTAKSLSTAHLSLASRFELRFDFAWVKVTSNGYLHVGPQPKGTKPAPAHENIWVYSLRGAKPSALTFNQYAIRREANEWPSAEVSSRKAPTTWGGQRVRGTYRPRRLSKRPSKHASDVFFVEPVRNAGLVVAKPLDLVRYLVLLLTNPGERVLDPFAGTGTTLKAAWLTGRRSVGYERDPDNFAILTGAAR